MNRDFLWFVSRSGCKWDPLRTRALARAVKQCVENVFSQNYPTNGLIGARLFPLLAVPRHDPGCWAWQFARQLRPRLAQTTAASHSDRSRHLQNLAGTTDSIGLPPFLRFRFACPTSPPILLSPQRHRVIYFHVTIPTWVSRPLDSVQTNLLTSSPRRPSRSSAGSPRS